MNADDYQKFCVGRAGDSCTYIDRDKVRCALGVAGEAGEVADLAKKEFFHGKKVPSETYLKELGDVVWYVAVMAYHMGYTMSDVMKANVDKLLVRYPNGFTVQDAEARRDVR